MPNRFGALPEESDLVARAKSDPDAFGAVYDHYFPRVYNFVRYRVGDPDVADDLTAKIFERVLRSLPRYRPGAVPFAVWLFKIAGNIVRDHYRGERRRRYLPLELCPDCAAAEPAPVERVVEEETKQELLAAVHNLGPREREILALKFAAGFTNREIARSTGLTESNVGVILYRIIRRLRAELCGGESNA